jgi:prepilin-type N-terminal cleavage/methylation domain-containing protein
MKRTKQLGFSMIELMIVLVIIMIVAAMATPNVARGIAVIRLRGGASSVAGLMQRSRIEAVRTNRIMTVRQALDADGRTPVYFVDGAMNGTQSLQNGTRDRGEPMVTTSSDLQLVTQANAPAFPVAQLLGYPQSNIIGPPMNMAFSQRGLPCAANSNNGLIGNCPTTDAAGNESSYQYFFRLQSAFGNHFASITVTPAGRIRVWVWNGTNWN